ncbi:MAG: hypothetical protein WCX74_01380 [Candidatus Paceibacterota bacterium]
MKLIFESKLSNKNGAEEYRKIWKEEGRKMVRNIQNHSGLFFKTKKVTVDVYDGKSTSHPLRLRHNYDIFFKKAVIIHELLHIIFVDNEIRLEDSLSLHVKLFRYYYDILLDMYGDDFLRKVIEKEKSFGEIYENAWNAVEQEKGAVSSVG